MKKDDIAYTQDIEYTSIDVQQGLAKNDYVINEHIGWNNDTLDKIKDYSNIIINMNRNAQSQKDFSNSIQKWIGYVKEIRTDSFTAILNDINNPTTNETADFIINDDISKEDMPLLKIGATFYWSIGYHVQNGQRKKESFIRFKRSVPFTEEDVDKIADNAKKLERRIRWK